MTENRPKTNPNDVRIQGMGKKELSHHDSL